MVQTDEERKAKARVRAKKYRDSTEGKAKRKLHTQTPEYKARQKVRRDRPEHKSKTKVYNSKPEVKAKTKERSKIYNSKPEVQAKKKAYNARPKSIAKRKAIQNRPDVKAKNKARKQTPEYKARQKAIQNRPDVKAKNKARKQTPEYKANAKLRSQRPDVRAKAKLNYQKPENKLKRENRQALPENKLKRKISKEKYKKSSKGKAKTKEYSTKWNKSLEYKTSRKKYNKTPNGRAVKKIREQRPENKANRQIIRQDDRLNVLQTYSKRLSTSDIPCCICCGFNGDLDFLAIDHIRGRKEMGSEPELIKLGYTSKLKNNNLIRWIIENDFPEGFQILCHNCNQAKGYYGKCPHKEEIKMVSTLEENETKTKNNRLHILQTYSKRLSNSDFPCCNCCGLNDNIKFLAIDHIRGREEMGSEPELIKLGYTSKLKNQPLMKWIIENDFPEGFQILCHNCNTAKGITQNNNECPMKNKPH